MPDAQGPLSALIGGAQESEETVRLAAGPLKVAVRALAPGRYRLKLRLQGDPDNPTLTRELEIGAG